MEKGDSIILVIYTVYTCLILFNNQFQTSNISLVNRICFFTVDSRRSRCVSFVISDNEELSFDVEDKEVQTEQCNEIEQNDQDILYVKPVTRTLEESHEALKIAGSEVSDQEEFIISTTYPEILEASQMS